MISTLRDIYFVNVYNCADFCHIPYIDEFDEYLSVNIFCQFLRNPTEHGAAILLLALHIK